MLPLAAAVLCVVLCAQTIEADDDGGAREHGWQVFEQARQAFRNNGHPAAVRDYTFHSQTEAHTPQGVARVGSQTYFIYPSTIRQEIETAQGPVVVVFNGDRGWRGGPAGRQELPAEAVDQIGAELAHNNILFGPEPDRTLLRYVGRDEVEGRSAEVIQIADVGGTLLRLFVDAETHDVLKHMFVGDTPQGLAQVEEIFSDFREVGGYRWYHHRKVVRNGKLVLESTRSDLRVNVGLDQAALLQDKLLR